MIDETELKSWATALETSYKGILFRSRSEARWAVFFDTLGIPWIYEPETYKFDLFSHTVLYLPDFWLPNQKCWFEVKGPQPTEAEQGKAMLLAKSTSQPVYVAWGGIPTYTPTGQTLYDGAQRPNANQFTAPTRLGYMVTSAWKFSPRDIVTRKKTTKRHGTRLVVTGSHETFHQWSWCPMCGYANLVLEGKLAVLTKTHCGCQIPRIATQNGKATQNLLAKAYNKARAERFGS